MPATQSPSQPVGSDQSTQALVFTASSVPDPPIGDNRGEAEGLETYYRLRSRTILDERKIACPIAAKPGSQPKTSEIITVSLGTAQLVVEWSAWRKSQRPQIPQPYVGDPNLTLMRSEIVLDGYEEEGDANDYFISSGVYYYAWNQRSQLTLSYPLAPFYDVQDKSMLVVKSGDFIPNVINAGWPSPAAKSAITQP